MLLGSSSLGRFSLGMSLISLMIVTLFLVVVQVTVVRDAHIGGDPSMSNTTGLSLFGELHLDLNARTSSIFWTVSMCDLQTILADRFIPNDTRAPLYCEPPNTTIDVYITNPSKPVFSYIPFELKGGAPIVWDHLSFATKHRIHKYDNLSPSTQLMISPGRYFLDTFVFAIDPTANRSVHIARLAVAGPVEDFVVRSYDRVATNIFAYNPGDGIVNMEVESHILRTEINPSTIALAIAISLFLLNWGATVGSIYITTLVILGKLEKNNVVAVGPFSALIVLPTIRSLYISSPPLVSPVESAAFFVQIAAVVLCSVILLKCFTSRMSQ